MYCITSRPSACGRFVSKDPIFSDKVPILVLESNLERKITSGHLAKEALLLQHEKESNEPKTYHKETRACSEFLKEKPATAWEMFSVNSNNHKWTELAKELKWSGTRRIKSARAKLTWLLDSRASFSTFYSLGSLFVCLIESLLQ